MQVVIYEIGSNNVSYVTREEIVLSSISSPYSYILIPNEVDISGLDITSLQSAKASLAQELEYRKLYRLSEINRLREIKLMAGFDYNFPGGNTGNVPLLPDTILTINGMVTTAMLLKDMPGFTLTFRDTANVNHTLTATDMITFALTCSSMVNTLYGDSWTCKQQISAATTLAELNAIVY